MIRNDASPSAHEATPGEDTVSDQALMERIRADDASALELLCDRYWSSLVAQAATVVPTWDDGQDVVQDAFIRLWRSRSDWSPSGPVGAYLHRITRNLALNAIRGREAQKKRDARGGMELIELASQPDPLTDVEATALQLRVQEAIARLPARRREIFVLSRFRGLTHREIARALGISRPTVANQLTAALAQLRQLLAPHLRKS